MPAVREGKHDRSECEGRGTGRVPPDISVIIPTYNDWSRLKICLGALERQTVDPLRFEVIVIDNASDHSCPFEDTLAKNVTIIREQKPGSYAARNTGVRAAAGDIFAFTDSDCVPSAQWLEAGSLAISKVAGKRHILGPIEIFRPEGCEDDAFLHDRVFAFRNRAQSAHTANLFVARNLFERVGQFDETLLSGGDAEWNARAARLGVSALFDLSTTIAHPARLTVAELVRKAQRTAGGAAVGKRPTLRYVLKRLLPPFKKLSSTPMEGLALFERLRLVLIVWRLELASAAEFLKIRLFSSAPRRQ